MKKMFSLQALFRNTFEGHEGRPGKVGGSLPQGAGSGSGSTGVEKVTDMRKQYQKALSSAYNANHVPSGSDAYRMLEEFLDDWEPELEEKDWSPKDRHSLIVRIKSAKKEQLLLKRKFGQMISE